MRFTVLGGSGFIGRHLAEHLRADGREVTAPPRGDWPPAGADLGHVVYAVGLTADYRTRPFDTLHAHATLVADLLREARFASLTYLSSTRVYAGSSSTDEAASIAVTPARAEDLYNISKLAGEAICLAQPRPEVRVVRLSNVVGPGTEQTDTFVGALCREARAGTIRLRTAPSSEKDYVWIGDVVAMLPKIAESGRERLYNLAGGRQIAHREWAEALVRLTGCSLSADPAAPEASFPPIRIDRLAAEFEYRPEAVLERIGEIVD